MLAKRRTAVQSPARTTPASEGSNSHAAAGFPSHMIVEMTRSSASGIEDPSPFGSGEQVSVAVNDFSDGSYALYTLYNEKTTEFDKALVDNWMEHVRDLMVLSGLISAAIAAFLAPFYQAALSGPHNVSAYYLHKIYLIQTNLSNTIPQDNPPNPQSAPFTTNILWFLGLGTSLSSAALAMLLQSWLRRYVVMTQTQQSPRGRALIRAYVSHAKLLNPLQLTLDFLHLLLDVSIFTFLAGLDVLLFTTAPDHGNFAILFLIAYILCSFYMVLSWRSVFYHTIYSTPFSRVLRHIKQFVLLILPSKSFFTSFKFLGHRSNALLSYDWVTLDRLDRVPEEINKLHDSSLDNEVVAWLLRSFHHDQDLERFLESIPRFYESDLVDRPEEIFRPHYKEQVPREILSFMHRALSSSTLPHDVKQRRLKLSLQVLELDLYLLEATFFHALSLPAKPAIFQCIDFVLVADRFAREANASLDVQFLAKCVIAVAISHITAQGLNAEHWPSVISRWLGHPISTSSINYDRQLANMKFDNLVSLVGLFNSSGPPYNEILPKILSTTCNFPVENVASESKAKFCALWNQLRSSATATPASLILYNIRTVYDKLHGHTSDTLANRDIQAVPASYPPCNDPIHRPILHSTPGTTTTDIAGEPYTVTTH